MKVNDPNLSGTQSNAIGNPGLEKSHQAEASRNPGRTGKGRVAGGSPDQVSLSHLSSQLQMLNVDSPERLQRLDKLSLDVAAKRYQVDAREVSHRLVEEALKPAL